MFRTLNKWDSIESSETNPHIDFHLTYDGAATADQGQVKQFVFNMKN